MILWQDSSALLSDPSSLHEAKERKSGSTEGSYLGSSFGFITGWLANVMTILSVIGGVIKKVVGKIASIAKRFGSWISNKLGKVSKWFGKVRKPAIPESSS